MKQNRARGRQWIWAGVTCKGPDCDRQAKALGLCMTHYSQQRAGKELKPVRAYNSTNRRRDTE